jgi:hypothetical protein
MTNRLSSALHDAIFMNQPDLIEPNLTAGPIIMATRQEELDTCLELAMPSASLDMIHKLLTLGATLVSHSLSAAVARQEPEILQSLIDFGWDINSTKFSLAAIQ